MQVADGQEVTARTVVLASGVAWRRLGIPALERLIGAGVFYGAAASEARAMRGRHVAVVGGGNAAGQAAAHLARYADQVTLLVRGDSLAKSMSEYLIATLRGLPNVTVRLGVEVAGGVGDEHLEAIIVRDRVTGTVERLPGGRALRDDRRRAAHRLARRRRRAGRARVHPHRQRPAGRAVRPIRRRCSRRACPVSSPPATSATRP